MCSLINETIKVCVCIHYALQLLPVILHPTSVLILICSNFPFLNIKKPAV